MVDFKLSPAPLLGGYSKDWGTVTLRERDDLAVVSMAIPLGADKKFASALKAAFKLSMPSATASKATKTHRALKSSADQLLLLFSHDTPDANAVVNAALKGAAYSTDQTDNWVALEIDGSGARTALERICPIDLASDVFKVGDFARTTMEHLGSLIIRTGNNQVLLMSASSSAKSFLHAVETSIQYTA